MFTASRRSRRQAATTQATSPSAKDQPPPTDPARPCSPACRRIATADRPMDGVARPSCGPCESKWPDGEIQIRVDMHHVTRYSRRCDQIVRGQANRTVLDHRQFGTSAAGNRTPGTPEALGARCGGPDRDSPGSSGQSPACTRGRPCRTALHIYKRPMADLLCVPRRGRVRRRSLRLPLEIR